jgi:hypothetical protein
MLPPEGNGMFESGGAFALVSFSFGVLIGYLCRDYVSRARRARYWLERKNRDQLRNTRSSIHRGT